MKVHELLAEINRIYIEKGDEIKYLDIVTHELIGGFMENIEGVKLEKDFFTDKDVIAIQFRNQ